VPARTKEKMLHCYEMDANSCFGKTFKVNKTTVPVFLSNPIKFYARKFFLKKWTATGSTRFFTANGQTLINIHEQQINQ